MLLWREVYVDDTWKAHKLMHATAPGFYRTVHLCLFHVPVETAVEVLRHLRGVTHLYTKSSLVSAGLFQSPALSELKTLRLDSVMERTTYLRPADKLLLDKAAVEHYAAIKGTLASLIDSNQFSLTHLTLQSTRWMASLLTALQPAAAHLSSLTILGRHPLDSKQLTSFYDSCGSLERLEIEPSPFLIGPIIQSTIRVSKLIVRVRVSTISIHTTARRRLSLAPMATIASLPPELVLLILSFAISSIASPSTPTPTYNLQRRQLLLRASLVSRAWRGPAQSLLWSEISFPTNEGVRRMIESEEWKKRGGRYRTRKLEVSNGVREYVGTLLEGLKGVEELYLGGVAVGEELFAYPALKNLKKVTMFRTPDSGHPRTAPSPSASPESPTAPTIDIKLPSLVLYYVGIDPSSTIASLLHSSRSSLRSLTFVNEALHESLLFLVQPFTRHLTHLVLDAVYTEDPYSLTYFFDSLASLSHLELPSNRSLLLPLRRCSRARIKHFTSLSLDSRPSANQIKWLLEVVEASVCEKLEVFEIPGALGGGEGREIEVPFKWLKIIHACERKGVEVVGC
ncbi:hypothetical protein MNV49_003620 [Pseudohyphozyma bogoriensis]|nr:hypothetical protein MNV49_003620 [Pseudohyphozyma bogoriensis]